MKRRILSFALASAMVVGPAAGAFADAHESTEVKMNNAYVKGTSETTFSPNMSLTREQVAVMIQRAYALAGSGSEADYEDASSISDWAAEAVATLQDEGLMEGTGDDMFSPKRDMTRAELATVLVRAYEEVTGEELSTGDASFDDVSGWSEEYIKKAATAGFVLGTGENSFAPDRVVTRAESVTMINRMLEVDELAEGMEDKLENKFTDLDDAAWFDGTQAVVASSEFNYTVNENGEIVIVEDDQQEGELVVESVSAINAKTLEISGTSLGELTADDITVENNTVSSVEASEDGTTATVVLGNSLNVGVSTKVTVLETEYDVLYDIEAKVVTITDGSTYDDDTSDQFVKINVDGKELTASELLTAGYDVEFEAYSDKVATSAASIFEAASSTSTTGELINNFSVPTEGTDYYVRVTLTRGAEVLTSPLAKIKVINKDLADNNITSAVLYNNTIAGDMNSSTMKTNEVGKFSEITVTSGSQVYYYTTGFTVKSSDESIISVDKTTNVFTAQGPGTATLTISFGGDTYTKVITVKNDAREASSVKVDKTSIVVPDQGTSTLKVTLLDQYGDPMDFTGDTDLKAVSSNSSIATASIGNPAGPKKEATMTISGVDTGSALFTFRDAADAKLGTTSVTANVTENAGLKQYSVAVDNFITNGELADINTALGTSLFKEQISTDATIDINGDAYVKLSLKGLNSAGQEIDPTPAASTYTVTTNVSAAGVLDTTFGNAGTLNGTSEQNGYVIVKAGTKAGTATITVKNDTDGTVYKTFQINVTDIGNNVTAATLKNAPNPEYQTTLNYKDFLSYTSTSGHPTITGLTLSKSASQPVRLDTSNGNLYIDKDGDAAYDATKGDIIVGSIAFGSAGTITNFTADAVAGFDVITADDGTVIFKVLNSEGEVVASKAVTVNF